MTNTVTMKLLLESNTDQETKKVEKLNKELEKTKKTASSVGRDNLRPAGSTAAAAKGKEASDTIRDNRLAKGLGGLTGAEGRDFAKQASGMGGLVHVYATFAANLFAVSAAFNALKKAADTTNMIEGLNQLGAASGKNLGNMAKNVALLSDGAVSMRQAMEATAQATAGGMSGEQLERMTKVAKSASQALGRDMGDALTRLSRGITKIEPELLDELGIMVRVDKAARDYARTLGKTATSLSEFERRQAFAVAVLEQGEKKFGNIKIDANPYAKLEASFFNIAQKGGEVLNKVLGPIAKILAESPTALATAMAGLGTLLLNKAIPALQGWRDNIRAAAEEAKNLAKGKVEAALTAKNKPKELASQAEVAADLQTTLQEQKLKRLSEIANKSQSKDMRKFIKTLEKSTALDTTDEQLDRLDKYARANKTNREEQIKLAKEFRESINIQKAAEIDLLKLKEESTRAEQEYQKALSNRSSIIRLNHDEAARLEKRAQKQSIVSEAIDTGSSLGLRAGWDRLKHKEEEANKSLEAFGKQLNWFDKVQSRVGFGIGMTISYISKLMNAFNWITAVIATAVAAFAILDGMLSKNSKQQEEYTNSLNNTASSLEGLGRTLEFVGNSKDPLDKLSPESLQSIANAIQEVSTSFTALAKNIAAAEKAASGWDKAIDWVKGLFGADNRSKLAKTSTNTINDILNSALPGKERSQLTAELEEILGPGATGSKKALEESLGALKDLEPEVYAEKYNKLTKATERYSHAINNSASNLTAYVEASKNTTKAMQDLSNSFIPSDHMSKFGIEQMNQATALAKALKSPEHALSALTKAVEDMGSLSIFPPEAAQDLLKYRAEILKINSEVGDLNSNLRALQTARRGVQQYEDVNMGTAEAPDMQQQETVQYAALTNSIEAVEKQRVESLKRVEEISGRLTKISVSLFLDGVKRLEQTWSAAVQKANIDYRKNLVSLFTQTPESIKVQTELQKQEISLQQQQIRSQIDLITSQEKLRVTMEGQSIREDMSILSSRLEAGKIDNREYDEKFAKLVKSLEINNAEQKIYGSNNFSKEVKAGLQSKDEATAAAAANARNTFAKVGQAQSQIAVLEKQKKFADFSGGLAAEDKRVENLQKLKDLENERKKIITETYKSELSSLGVYDEALASKYLLLAAEEDKAAIQKQQAENERASLRNAQLIVEAEKTVGTNHKEYAAAVAGYQQTERENTIKLATLKDRIAVNEKSRAQEISKLKIESYRQEVELQTKILEVSSFILEVQQESGSIGEGEAIERKAILELRKAELEQAVKLKTLEESKANASTAEAKAAIQDQIDYQMKLNSLSNEMITIQANYRKELVKTGDTLKQLEQGGEYFTEKYFNTLAQDFSDKIHTALDTAKRAGSILTEGIIGAFDKTIDKLGEMLQMGELNIKELTNLLRQELSNAFRDSAMQILKDEWKKFTKGFLPESSQDRAARIAEEQSKALVESQKNTATSLDGLKTATQDSSSATKELTAVIRNWSPSTSLPSTNTMASSNLSGYFAPKDFSTASSPLSDFVGPLEESSKMQTYNAITIGDAATKQQASAKITEESAGIFSSSSKIFDAASTLAMAAASTGNKNAQIFAAAVSIFKMLSQTSSTSSAVSGGSSGGFFGNILGNIFGGSSGGSTAAASTASAASSSPGIFESIGSFFTSLWPFAKGGIIEHSKDLSAHSNSIVNAPTLFKFAKGHDGLMGEAGPEAIIPLKRDEQGNLGIRMEKEPPSKEPNKPEPKPVTVINNFSVPAPTDRRTQEQISVMVGSAINNALARGS